MIAFAELIADRCATDRVSADRFLEATQTSHDEPPSRREWRCSRPRYQTGAPGSNPGGSLLREPGPQGPGGPH